MTYLLTYILCSAYGNSILRNRQIGQTVESTKGMLMTWLGCSIGLIVFGLYPSEIMDTTIQQFSTFLHWLEPLLFTLNVPIKDMM